MVLDRSAWAALRRRTGGTEISLGYAVPVAFWRRRLMRSFADVLSSTRWSASLRNRSSAACNALLMNLIWWRYVRHGPQVNMWSCMRSRVHRSGLLSIDSLSFGVMVLQSGSRRASQKMKACFICSKSDALIGLTRGSKSLVKQSRRDGDLFRYVQIKTAKAGQADRLNS